MVIKLTNNGNDIQHQPPNIHLHTSKCCYFTGNFQQEFKAQFDLYLYHYGVTEYLNFER